MLDWKGLMLCFCMEFSWLNFVDFIYDTFGTSTLQDFTLFYRRMTILYNIIPGTLCEFKNNCFNNPCENGGRCIVKEADESQCDCIDERTGPTCSLLIPPGCRAITGK